MSEKRRLRAAFFVEMTMFPDALPPGLGRVFLDAAGTQAAIAVDTPACTALIALQGAQVLRMQPRDGAPLLWLSPAARYLPGKAVRGGIPLCFPWFGDHPEDPAQPAHGFARNLPWRFSSADIGDDGTTRLVFELVDDAHTRRLWPHPFLARLTHRLGATLVTELQLVNTGPAAFTFGFALHNYFPVTDIGRVRVEGLGNTPCIDKLQVPSRTRNTDETPLRIVGETDCLFPGAGGDYRVVDESEERVIHIRTNCPDAVLWNPWQAKAGRLGDMPGESWRGMLCLESGAVTAQAVRLAPGESRSFRQEISARSLRD